MNEYEVKGAVRHLKGRAESAVGSLAGDLGRQAEGAFDQIAGGLQYAAGRASGEAEDLVERGRAFVQEAGNAGARTLREARQRRDDVVETGTTFARGARRRGASYATEASSYADRNRALTVVAVAAVAFAVGWLSRTSTPRRR